MDRQTIIGFVLIALVFTGWMLYTSMQTPPPPAPAAETPTVISDSGTAGEKGLADASQPAEASKKAPASSFPDSLAPNPTQYRYGTWFSPAASGTEQWLTVETDKYTAVFSTRGGSIKRWTLKNQRSWNQKPLQLVDWEIPSDLGLFFLTSDGKEIDTRGLFHRFDGVPAGGRVELKDSASFSFRAILPVRGDSMAIIRTYTLRNGSYTFDVDVEMKNMAAVIANYEYQATLHSLALTEENSVDEASFAKANALVGSEMVTLDASSAGEKYEENIDGEAFWASTHNKYFINALIARDDFRGTGIYMNGVHRGMPNEGVREIYEVGFKVRYGGQSIEKARFTYYLGPLEYDLLKAQHDGLQRVVDLGWAWIVRPFAEYLILPLFTFLHSFIANFGVVIIIFTILIKILLYPLTKSSMASMKKMQALQPLMAELREKYKDDQQRQNTEVMKLYKDYGVNPAGGCLPLLLQMPILFALFSVFRSSFQLRQEPFMLWITDLATADVLFHLPFKMPLLGTSAISGLALAMAVTMFIQQKQTVTDPRQKSMIYIMPVMFWIMFNGFPSGLNLYYFLFNLLSIGQQWYVNKKGGDVALVKVDPKKRTKQSWAERAMKSLEDKAKEQQKSRKK